MFIREFLSAPKFRVAGLAITFLALNALLSATVAAEEHWAFRRIQRVVWAATSSNSASLNMVDSLVTAQLNARGLRLAAPADRATFVRRLTLDVTGLPPTPDEVAAFSEDLAPDAHERLVDRLLAAPRFGERWGKFWLDAAGYADSNGYFNADSDRPLAWRYRDYVIAAHNADKPFDQFLREQLAGDELADIDPAKVKDADPKTLPTETVDTLVATHFLRNAPDGSGESDGNPDEVRVDRYSVLEGTIQVLGSSLFGLTLHCARCHDHKFEPVSQREYYQLQAILFPAYNPDQWHKPNDRVLEIAGQKIAWLTDVSPTSPDVRLLVRGDYKQRGEIVPPSVLAVLAGDELFRVTPPASGRTTGNRLAFAQWLTKSDSRAAALLARVTVNRIWQQHFDRGLVQTPDNLGISGAAPTHPELLDYLAGEFVRGGWSMKSLHRLILTSATYRQTSSVSDAAAEADPDDRWLSRFPLKRLDADTLRDAMLATSGELDRTLGGAYVPTKRNGVGEVVVEESVAGFRRRSVYLQQRRTQVETLLATFDAPSIVTNCTRRPQTTTPIQSLSQLNSSFIRGRAKQFAARLVTECGGDEVERIRRAFLLTAGRSPTADEVAGSKTFLIEQAREYPASADAATAAWVDFCQVLLAGNMFVYIE